MTLSWTIPRAVLRATETAFRQAQHEVFVLWTAPNVDAAATIPVSRCIVPHQTPGETPTGVYVHIEGTELARIQFENFDRGEWNVVQLHTHPGADVRMSELDRDWEVVNHVGALSIIVPHYGAMGLEGFRGVNVYEREERDWRLWNRAEVASRIKLV